MAEIKRDDFPALYENAAGEYAIVPDWKSGPVGYFRSKRSLEEFEAEQAAEQAAEIERNEAFREETERRAREEGAAVRAAIQERERKAAEALEKRAQAARDASGKKSEPSPLAKEPASPAGDSAAGDGSAGSNPLAGFFKAAE